MTTETRIYRVDDARAAKGESRTALIRAANSAQAVRHAAQCFSVRVATQDDIAELVAGGVRIVDANGESK